MGDPVSIKQDKGWGLDSIGIMATKYAQCLGFLPSAALNGEHEASLGYVLL